MLIYCELYIVVIGDLQQSVLANVFVQSNLQLSHVTDVGECTVMIPAQGRLLVEPGGLKLMRNLTPACHMKGPCVTHYQPLQI